MPDSCMGLWEVRAPGERGGGHGCGTEEGDTRMFLAGTVDAAGLANAVEGLLLPASG